MVSAGAAKGGFCGREWRERSERSKISAELSLGGGALLGRVPPAPDFLTPCVNPSAP